MTTSPIDALNGALGTETVATWFTRRKDGPSSAENVSFDDDFYLEIPLEARDGGLFTLTIAGSQNAVDTVTLSAGRGIPMWWIEDAMNIALELFPTSQPLQETFVLLFTKLAKKYEKLDRIYSSSNHAHVQDIQPAQVANPQPPVPNPPKAEKPPFNSESMPKFFESRTATNALMSQLRIIGNMDTRKEGFEIEPFEDDLYKWRVRLYFDDEKTPLAKDLAILGKECVNLELKFPGDYPFVPPFCRVVSPLFIAGSGHVMRHGALCHELLTTHGWTPANSIDTVCIQIRALLLAGRARLNLRAPAKLQMYTEKGARLDYHGIVAAHGWHVGKPGYQAKRGTTGFNLAE